ncbi:gp53-like domain-containing protein [Photorhabdus antumapuensis]|uniref:gp53-like domain-containing protein n=1 Tax=Photorhabdus antumapuensis TaxID=2862867 RepID=UPI001CEC263B|nr:tail fiber protein [Photorhabdus antumapuensis]MCA6219331.1 phage tail protein [Photorhabdus antumapuensis]
MSNKNDFKAFSISQDANVVSQGEYEESQELNTGIPPNIISIGLLNKVLRQSSTISSVVANFISTQCSDDVLDDGDIDKLTTQLNIALEQKALTEIPSASLTQKGVIQLTDALGDSNTLAVTQKLVQEIITSLSESINSRVPNIRQVNGKALSEDIDLDAVDIGVYTKEEVDNEVNAKGNRNSASKAINGWWRCGDTGVIYQWGRTKVIDAGRIERIRLPISFSNRQYSININPIQSKLGLMGASVGYVNVIDDSSFDLLNSWVNAKWDSPFFWIAIGY